MTEDKLPTEYYVIGADLSLNRPGFIVMKIHNKDIDVKKIDCVDNKSKPNKKPRGQTLTEIAQKMRQLVELVPKDTPFYLVREKSINNASFGRRSGTAARTGISEVCGVVDLIAWEHEKEWDEIYPVTIKKLVAGSGKALKEAVAAALPDFIGKQEYHNDDESDAAAVAVAWLIQHNVKEIKDVPSKSDEPEGRSKQNNAEQNNRKIRKGAKGTVSE